MHSNKYIKGKNIFLKKKKKKTGWFDFLKYLG